MLPASGTHPRLHRRNPRINFLIVTNHRCVLKDSDFSSVSILKRSSEDSTDTPLNATMKSPSRIPAFHAGEFGSTETTKSTFHSIAAIPNPIRPCPIANTKTSSSHVQSTGSYPPTTFGSSSPSKQCERQGLLLHQVSRRLCKMPSGPRPPGDAAMAAIYCRSVLAFVERCDTLSFLELA